MRQGSVQRPRKVELPHRAALEQSFGTPLGDVQAYTGAGRLLDRLGGAQAAAHGDAVAFADARPTLRTAAHEVAHVLQHRQAGALGGGVSDSGAAEADARQAADAVVAGAPAEVSAAPGGDVQLWNPFKKKKQPVATPTVPFRLDGGQVGNIKWGLDDADVDTSIPIVRGDGGSLNRVDRIHYADGIGTSGEKLGFFKPEGGAYKKIDQKRAIASTRLDQMLGFGLQPQEFMASHGGEVGTVSPKVAGTPLYDVLFDQAIDTNGVDADTYIAAQMEPQQYKKHGDGSVTKTVGHSHNRYHDYANPVTQKGLADLQLSDAILGQIDRHGGNIYIDNATGNVRGIDNDKAFSHWEVSGGWDHYRGLPSQVDAGTAQRLLDTDIEVVISRLEKEMRFAGAGALPEKDLKRLRERFAEVKTHVQGLKDNNLLIGAGGWGAATYQAAMNEADGVTGRNQTGAMSYVKRAATMYNDAASGAAANDTFEAAPVVQAPPLQRPAIPRLNLPPRIPKLDLPPRVAQPPARTRPMRQRQLTPRTLPMAAPPDVPDMPAAPQIDIAEPEIRRKRPRARAMRLQPGVYG